VLHLCQFFKNPKGEARVAFGQFFKNPKGEARVAFGQFLKNPKCSSPRLVESSKTRFWGFWETLGAHLDW
jgi:hypothetical protein